MEEKEEKGKEKIEEKKKKEEDGRCRRNDEKGNGVEEGPQCAALSAEGDAEGRRVALRRLGDTVRWP